jgi:hypothetical protein
MKHELDETLDGLRATPREDFVDALLARIEEASRPVPKRWPKTAAVGAVTTAMLGALSAVGGVSYAATAVTHAASVASGAVSKPKQRESAIVIRGLSSGGDQYRPGYGFGDPNHNHDGPPGLTRSGGESAPPLESRPAGQLAKVAGTTVTFDEQVHLYISVIDGNGTPLLLTQSSKRGGTSVGGDTVTGPQTKFIQYVVRVPRAIPMGVRIPENLLREGATYRIRIVAIDPDGNRSTLLIPFRA